ncbi:MAG TPA: protein-methionine-sulfoxide reductase heme-binding subunit MsrQ [Rhodocyclaceae bacterium]|nr:protein-methionine-sulfoxide reductase heme-binding subunit MsrQ [Rhodocyclaceae bacterium]
MAAVPSPRQLAGIKAALFAACLLPLAFLIYGIVTDTLGANPIEALTRGLGDWTLRFLLLTLLITPLRRLTRRPWLIQLRRMLGLYAFFYAVLHMTSYVWLDQFFDWGEIAKDVVKRPFITAGFTAFLLLIPLAATSTNAMVRRLGGKRWRSLHRAVYAIAILGVLHYWWLVKKDITQPAIYAILLAVLLGMRVFWRLQETRRGTPAVRLQS